ncbi:TusE/DsrC/DsvC family sulfur relay protein [Thiolapillus sp.]
MATASTLYPERMQAPDNFDDWSEEHAIQMAREDGIQLDDARWEVIY